MKDFIVRTVLMVLILVVCGVSYQVAGEHGNSFIGLVVAGFISSFAINFSWYVLGKKK